MHVDNLICDRIKIDVRSKLIIESKSGVNTYIFLNGDIAIFSGKIPFDVSEWYNLTLGVCSCLALGIIFRKGP